MSVRSHTRLEGHVQHAINKHHRSLLVELAREDLRKATSSLPVEDAAAYRAEMRRLLVEVSPINSPKLSARETADRFFKIGGVA